MSFGVQNPTDPADPSYGYGYGGSESSGERGGVQNPDFIWGPQAGYLQQLYGMGSNLANNFGQYQQGAQNIFNTATQGFNQLMNPGVNPQLEAYQGEVQRNLERNMLPTIRGNAGGFGQMGSSRQGIAEGLAVSDANQAVTDMAANLYSEDRNRMLGALGMSGQLGNFGMSIPWYAMNQFSGLLGKPTALGGGGEQWGSESSSQFGEDWRWGGGGGGGGGGFEIGIPIKP